MTVRDFLPDIRRFVEGIHDEDDGLDLAAAGDGRDGARTARPRLSLRAAADDTAGPPGCRAAAAMRHERGSDPRPVPGCPCVRVCQGRLRSARRELSVRCSAAFVVRQRRVPASGAAGGGLVRAGVCKGRVSEVRLQADPGCSGGCVRLRSIPGRRRPGAVWVSRSPRARLRARMLCD